MLNARCNVELDWHCSRHATVERFHPPCTDSWRYLQRGRTPIRCKEWEWEFQGEGLTVSYQLLSAFLVRRIACMQLELGVPLPLESQSEDSDSNAWVGFCWFRLHYAAASRLLVTVAQTASMWVKIEIDQAQVMLERCVKVRYSSCLM